MLEPDNTLRRKVFIEPPAHIDAGGLADANPALPSVLREWATVLGKKHRPKFSWDYSRTGLVSVWFYPY